MKATKDDFSILDNFRFEIEPVGVKYFARQPDNIPHIEQKMTLCEMLVNAQKGHVFYSEAKDHTCGAGPFVLGQVDIESPFVSGEYGSGLQVFRDARAAGRLYHYIPHIARNVVNYAAFSPLSKLQFEPDVLLVLANIGQAEVLLRAMSYRNGQMWSSKYSAAVGCAWLFVYPYLTGEINFITTGLGFGMRRRKLFPEGRMFVSIPFDKVPTMLDTLREMPWVPEPYTENGPEFARQLRIRLGIEE
ncbi:MAG TPA: DUF169 domain-containing protein [Syntrophorhabdaceae bacterium]|nr:DUF169 domain-containing protein [Syntrophorhabdaceae bacterium]